MVQHRVSAVQEGVTESGKTGRVRLHPHHYYENDLRPHHHFSCILELIIMSWLELLRIFFSLVNICGRVRSFFKASTQ